jgi:hypothetical protein
MISTGVPSVRKSTMFIIGISANGLICLFLVLYSRVGWGKATTDLVPCTELVKELQLTDLCLFTEARYTRNPAMADLHAPFQDHPLALEHFPSGSLVTPPRFRQEAP